MQNVNVSESASEFLAAPPPYSGPLKEYYRFVSAQGLRIVEDETCYWVEKRKRFWESAPSHRRVRLSPAIEKKLFSLGAVAIRYTCPDGEGSPTYEYIWDDVNYSLDSLAKDARRNVRKNLETCVFRPITFEQLLTDGLAINQNVYSRQNRKSDFQTEPAQWNIYMETCSTLSFVKAYGIFLQERLVAYSMVLFVDDYSYTFHPYAHSDYMKFYPMNVLIFSLVQQMLHLPGVRCVSYGVESYTSRPTLERFKVAMGCRKSELRRQIVVNPLFRPAFSESGSRLAERVLRLIKPGMADDFSIFSRAVRGLPSAESVEITDSQSPE